MNLDMVQPINETETLLLSITKNCETLFEKTHRKAEGRLEFKMTKPIETIHFNPAIQIKGDWTISLTSLEVYNSTSNFAEKYNKFELYTDNFNEFSYEEFKYELENILSISDITSYHLQHEKIGPRIIKAYGKLKLEKSKTGRYIILILGDARSPFREVECFLRIVVGLGKDDVQILLKQ